MLRELCKNLQRQHVDALLAKSDKTLKESERLLEESEALLARIKKTTGETESDLVPDQQQT